MSELSSKTFDCVASLRQARDKLNAEIEGISYDELVKGVWRQEQAETTIKLLGLKGRQFQEARQLTERFLADFA